MKVIGYERVSTQSQKLDRQRAALDAYPCDEIYSEKASGKTTKKRPQLARALARLAPGDVFVVAEWDRATRSFIDGLALMQQIHTAGATIVVLDRKALDLTTPLGKAILGVLSAIYEEERTRILTRSKQGQAQARRRGKLPGRPASLNAQQAAEIRAEVRGSTKVSYRGIARRYGVHHQTVSRIAKQRDTA